MSQESPLLAGTVKENLCIGLEKEPNSESIEAALQAARTTEFVE